MERALDIIAIWLSDHPRMTCALVCAAILACFALDAPH
jgi:hypothetical protein